MIANITTFFGASVPADRLRRRRAYRRGHWAERLASLALLAKGFRTVARRHKTRLGEVDLIARRGDLVLLVEVKARRDVQSGLDAITRTAERRIEAAGEMWLSRQPDYSRLSWRCDVVIVTPWRWPHHFVDVW